MKIFYLFIIILIFLLCLRIIVKNFTKNPCIDMKVGIYNKKTFNDIYSIRLISKCANMNLGRFYMYGLENVVKRDFQKVDIYCSRGNSCYWLYKDAIHKYCQYDDTYYADQNFTKDNLKLCVYLKNRWEKLRDKKYSKSDIIYKEYFIKTLLFIFD